MSLRTGRPAADLGRGDLPMLPNMEQPMEPVTDARPPEDPGGFRLNIFVCLLALLGGLVLGGAAGMKTTGVSFSSMRGDWHDDLEDGLDEMEDTGKPLLVYYTADWCPPCKDLKKHVFSRDDVEAYLASTFVRVKVDLTKQSGPNAVLAAEYEVSGIPTMIVYDMYGDEIDRMTGGEPIQAWLMDQVYYD